MTKKLLAILFATIFLLFISIKFTNFVQAQVGQVDQAPAAQIWRCLKAEQIGQKDRKPPPEVDVVLSGVGFPSAHDIFVVLCVPPVTTGKDTPSNYQCSTGNSQSDYQLFNSNLTKKIDPITFEIPVGTSPPQKVQAEFGNLNLTTHMSNIQGHVSYAWFGVTINEPKLVSQNRADTIQYATFQFEQDPAKCVSIRWDPFGRLFDSQSLEPISRVKVSLLYGNPADPVKYKKLVVVPVSRGGLVNPQTTEVDGLFNFFVHIREGGVKMFILDPLPLPPLQHTFTATPNLHPNYVKAYSDLYKPDEIIAEAAGVPEHRDIPLDPGSGPLFASDPKMMSIASVKIGGSTRFEGVISHPLSIVTLVGKISQQEVARATADKNGFWEIVVPNAIIPQFEALQAIIIKVDLRTLTYNSPQENPISFFFKFLVGSVQKRISSFDIKVSAQNSRSTDSSAEFPPILSYIEGYARDQNGKVIPNATVRIKLEMSDGVYYQTTADENGFFSVPPQNLPIFNYYLEFLAADSASLVKMTTAEFAQMNQDYLSANNVNLMAAVKNGQSLIPTTPANPAPTKTLTQSNGQNNKNLNVLMTVIALVVLLGVAGGVLLYIKKKEAQADNLF